MFSEDFKVVAFLTDRKHCYTQHQCGGIEFHGDKPLIKLEDAEDLLSKVRKQRDDLLIELARWIDKHDALLAAREKALEHLQTSEWNPAAEAALHAIEPAIAAAKGVNPATPQSPSQTSGSRTSGS